MARGCIFCFNGLYPLQSGYWKKENIILKANQLEVSLIGYISRRNFFARCLFVYINLYIAFPKLQKAVVDVCMPHMKSLALHARLLFLI